MLITSDVFLVITVISALCGVASSIMITAELEKRGVKINWIFLRVFIVSRYLNQYRDITRQESGKTGPLFYWFIIAMNVALVTAILGLVLRVL
jgi:hypothetical protein